MVNVDFTGVNFSPVDNKIAIFTSARLQGTIFTDSKLYGADLRAATVSFENTTVNAQYCTPGGKLFPGPKQYFPLKAQPTQGLNENSFSNDSVCPNGETFKTNKEKGNSLTKMLTIPNPENTWAPVQCFNSDHLLEKKINGD